MYKGNPIKLSADFSEENWWAKSSRYIQNAEREKSTMKNTQPRKVNAWN